MRIALAAFALVLAASPAFAGPVFLAILSAGGTLGAALGATALGSFLTSTVGRLLVGVAVSALGRARAAKPRDPGLQTSVTQAGGTNPVSLILGRYATAGTAVAPPMSHGDDNKYLVYVTDVSDLPCAGLSRLVIDGEYVPLGATPDADGFLPVTGRFAGFARVKFKAGTQSVADPWLIATYGSYPERPWTSDMVGTGVAYVILELKYDREVFQGLPACRYEVDGAKLYDPRFDTTVGGSGAQRWATPATWGFTLNPVVMVYNILRGITLADGSVWGGRAAAADLPLANWFAAMNECDVAISLTGGGTEPQFRAGFEVTVDEEPAGIIEELLKGCSGAITLSGRTWKIRVGPPGLPVYFFTDADVLVSRPQDFDPFPGLDDTFNGIQARYPEPTSLWEAKDAPARFNATWEAEDGGRRLVADVAFSAVPYGGQVQRLMQAMGRDHRRMRRHTLTLPPEAAILEPLDTVAWTSTRNGYAAKLLEVGQVADEAMSLQPTVALREVDPDDYDWIAADGLPVSLVPAVIVPPGTRAITGFAVAGVSISDGSSNRRPGLRLTWTASALRGARGLTWELRPSGGAVILRGDTQDWDAGSLTLTGGLVADTAYEVRARALGDAPGVWTGWTAASTPDLRLAGVDLADEAVTRGGVAGSSSVTNNSASWTTVCSFTLASLPLASYIQGTLACTWSQPPSALPAGFEMRVTINGIVVVFLPRATLQNDDLGFLFRPFTRQGITAGSIDVVFEIRNAGGQGVLNSNLQAMAVMR